MILWELERMGSVDMMFQLEQTFVPSPHSTSVNEIDDSYRSCNLYVGLLRSRDTLFTFGAEI